MPAVYTTQTRNDRRIQGVRQSFESFTRVSREAIHHQIVLSRAIKHRRRYVRKTTYTGWLVALDNLEAGAETAYGEGVPGGPNSVGLDPGTCLPSVAPDQTIGDGDHILAAIV